MPLFLVFKKKKIDILKKLMMLPCETKHTTMVENLSYPEVASVQIIILCNLSYPEVASVQIIILRNLSSLLLYSRQKIS